MATDRKKTARKSLWKRIKKNVRKATGKLARDGHPDEETPFLEKSASQIELAKTQKSEKRKKSLKKFKLFTVAACRYIGIGASLSAHGYGQGPYPMYPDIGIGSRTEYSYYL